MRCSDDGCRDSKLVKTGIPVNKGTPIYADRENITETGEQAANRNDGLILESVILSVEVFQNINSSLSRSVISRTCISETTVPKTVL